MKLLFLFIPFIFIAFKVPAQKIKPKEDFYIFKADWSPAPNIEAAVYFARMTQLADTCWQWDVYNFMGPLIKSEHYKDGKLTQLHGRQHYFKITGYLDSAGTVTDGVQHGDWAYFGDSGLVNIKKKYDHGSLIEVIDQAKENASAKKDTSSNNEKESSFPGGITKWQQYLSRNLNYPDRAYKANIMGEVTAQFVVDKEGNVTDVHIFKSVEYSLDEETMRLLKKSPKWIPATQNGKVVRSYKRQPLRYKM